MNSNRKQGKRLAKKPLATEKGDLQVISHDKCALTKKIVRDYKLATDAAHERYETELRRGYPHAVIRRGERLDRLADKLLDLNTKIWDC